MKKTIFKSLISSLVFVIGVLVFGFLVLKVMAGITNVSSGSPLTAQMWNDMVSQVFQKNGTSLYYMTGRVGIGIDTPSAALHIEGNNALNAGFWLRNSTAGGSAGMYIDNSAIFHIGAPGATQIISANLANGKVGIGITNPSEKLDLGGGNIKMGYERTYCTHPAASLGWLSCSCAAGKQLISGTCRYSGGGGPLGFDYYSTYLNCYKTSNGDSIYMTLICANIK